MQRRLLLLILLFLCTWVGATEIIVEPSTTVAVGTELYFDGSEFTVAGATVSSNGIMKEGEYAWDFGDGFSDVGTTAIHRYIRPGVYEVELAVNDVNDVNDSNTVTITVTGDWPELPPRPPSTITPVLELRFEDNLTDSSGNDANVVWVGTPKYTAAGADGSAADFTDGAYIVIDDNDLLDGFTNGLTISLWAKKPSDANYGWFVNKGLDVYRLKLHFSGGSPNLYARIGADTATTIEIRNDLLYRSRWYHYALVYENDVEMRLYLDGREIYSKALSGDIKTNSTSVTIGADDAGGNKFNGYIDEIKIYDSALTEAELLTAFELLHADYHGHTSQYIYAQIPPEYTAVATNHIKAVVTDDGVYSDEIYDESSMESEEAILLVNSDLDAANYTLTVQILDVNDVVLDEIAETFAKPYDGNPISGIDANLAIRVNGELFFPVTPWARTDLATWNETDANTYMNTSYGTGFGYGGDGDGYSLADWNTHLNNSNTNSLYAIGPSLWSKMNAYLTDPNAVEQFIATGLTKPAMLMWMWRDEPDWGGPDTVMLRCWTYICHRDDPNRLVAINLVGLSWDPSFDSHWGDERQEWEYLYNANQFGGGNKGFNVTDVYGLDLYPVAYRISNAITVADLARVLDTFAAENPYVPFMSFVETCQIGGSSPAAPTAAQLKMLIWLNVVHGAKGINWFHYFQTTPSANFDVMEEFLIQITELTPFVLSGDTVASVSDDADITGNRVDTMIKVADANLYIFATRLTEITAAQSDDDKTVTFVIEGVNDVDMTVYGESRTVSVVGNVFTDTFVPNAVHIYSTDTFDLSRPNTPTSLAADSNTYTSITVSWSGTSIAYDIVVDGTTNHLNVTSPYEITGLSSGTSYDIEVWGKTAAGMRSLTADELTTSTAVLIQLPTPIAHYKMDDDTATAVVVDTIGNYNGTYKDSGGNINTDTGSTTGRINNALEFDGDEYIERDSQLISSYPFSVSCWVASDAEESGSFFWIGDKDVTNKFYALRFVAGKILIYARTPSEGQKVVSSTNTFNDGEWHHVVGVWSGSANRKLYVNGTLEVSDTNSVLYSSAVDRISIGRFGDSTPGNYFLGKIDNVMIFDEALSQGEIDFLYNNIAPLPNPATFASPPNAVDNSSITMTATTATYGATPIEYYFDETSNNFGGSDSGWQQSTDYTDSGLSASTQYTYRLRTRDSLGNTGDYSSSLSATTDSAPEIPDTDPPVPNPATWASEPSAGSSTTITMTATEGEDENTPTEYFFDEISGHTGGSDSEWQPSNIFTDTGLLERTEYTYRVRLRDGLGNVGDWSVSLSAITEGEPAIVVPLEFRLLRHRSHENTLRGRNRF